MDLKIENSRKDKRPSNNWCLIKLKLQLTKVGL